MYISKVRIYNVKSIGRIEWSLPRFASRAGWHVILGDEGSGKSSFLRSIALAIIGPRDAAGLGLSWDDWLTKGEPRGAIIVTIERNPAIDRFTQEGPIPRTRRHRIGVVLFDEGSPAASGVALGELRARPDSNRHVWGDGGGWFCAAYRPFRRLAEGGVASDRLPPGSPKLARFLSIFDDRVALTDCLERLRDLKSQQLEARSEGDRAPIDFLRRLTRFINQPGFLPSQARLAEISSGAVVFRDGNGEDISIEDLGDGFRSVLSLTFELIGHLSRVYGPDAVFDEDDPGKVACEGVVLLDDIDVHLPPDWQRRIGPWFHEHFPRIQFLVSARSPLISQAADIGMVFRLPTPGVDEAGEPQERGGPGAAVPADAPSRG